MPEWMMNQRWRPTELQVQQETRAKVRVLMNAYQITQREFAAFFGINKSEFSRRMSAQARFNATELVTINKMYRVLKAKEHVLAQWLDRMIVSLADAGTLTILKCRFK